MTKKTIRLRKKIAKLLIRMDAASSHVREAMLSMRASLLIYSANDKALDRAMCGLANAEKLLRRKPRVRVKYDFSGLFQDKKEKRS